MNNKVTNAINRTETYSTIRFANEKNQSNICKYLDKRSLLFIAHVKCLNALRCFATFGSQYVPDVIGRGNLF